MPILEPEPELIFDISSPSPGQEKIIAIISKTILGAMILFEVGDELCKELKKYRSNNTL